MVSFLARSRLFAARLTVRTAAPYLLDLLGLLLLAGVWLGVAYLAPFARGEPVVTASPYDAAMIACIGLYGVRLSMWLAILRGNLMPQTGEWLLCLIPLGVAVLGIAFSGALVRGYAGASGYHRCADSHYERSRLYVFAAAGRPCPAGQPG